MGDVMNEGCARLLLLTWQSLAMGGILVFMSDLLVFALKGLAADLDAATAGRGSPG
jgi:hypothetical protein